MIQVKPLGMGLVKVMAWAQLHSHGTLELHNRKGELLARHIRHWPGFHGQATVECVVPENDGPFYFEVYHEQPFSNDAMEAYGAGLIARENEELREENMKLKEQLKDIGVVLGYD